MRFSRKQLGIPYAVFLVCFVIAPLLVVLYYAFTNGQGQFTVQNFVNFFTSENTIGTLAYSLVTAVTVTVATIMAPRNSQNSGNSCPNIVSITIGTP